MKCYTVDKHVPMWTQTLPLSDIGDNIRLKASVALFHNHLLTNTLQLVPILVLGHRSLLSVSYLLTNTLQLGTILVLGHRSLLSVSYLLTNTLQLGTILSLMHRSLLSVAYLLTNTVLFLFLLFMLCQQQVY